MADYGEYGDFEEFDLAMEELAEELEKKKYLKDNKTITADTPETR